MHYAVHDSSLASIFPVLYVVVSPVYSCLAVSSSIQHFTERSPVIPLCLRYSPAPRVRRGLYSTNTIHNTNTIQYYTRYTSPGKWIQICIICLCHAQTNIISARNRRHDRRPLLISAAVCIEYASAPHDSLRIYRTHRHPQDNHKRSIVYV